MTQPWRMPSGMTGSAQIVRIGASAGDDQATCAARIAAKARPGVRPAVWPDSPESRYDEMMPGRIHAVLDRYEFDGVPVAHALAELTKDDALHEGARQWIRHAVETYVASGVHGGPEPLDAVRRYWVTQHVNQRTWELYAWGRRYQSADGLRREFRFLRNGHARQGPLARTQVAIAAYTTAFGSPADWPRPWREPFRPAAGCPVSWVRVVEVRLLDGSQDVLFEGTVEEAEALYAEHGRERVRQIAVGGPPRASADCADCKLLSTCPAVRRAPNLLGIASQRRALRTWSVSDGRYYATCPAQEHLRRIKLPKIDEYDPDAIRGHAVHAWLEETHGGMPRVPCRMGDTPLRADDWTAGRWHVTGEEAMLGARMIAQHATVCAFQHADHITEVRLEPSLCYFDDATNLIILAKPDMLYLENNGWVWREIKTVRRHRRMDTDVLQRFPQLALGVLILSANLLGGDPSGHRVELETLTPDDADIEPFDASDPAIVVHARAIVRALAEPWHRDDVAVAQPGPHCHECPVRRWCPAYPGPGPVS